jgi:hypothetical protein
MITPLIRRVVSLDDLAMMECNDGYIPYKPQPPRFKVMKACAVCQEIIRVMVEHNNEKKFCSTKCRAIWLNR